MSGLRRICDLDEYYNYFDIEIKTDRRNEKKENAPVTNDGDGDFQDKKSVDRYENALKIALDIRKFEIDLYWKRAGYFWAFLAAIIAGYVAIENSNFEMRWSIMLLLSALGLIIAVAFYFVNKGSKFWQLNWERHVDLLEDRYMGPLYKCICVSDGTLHQFFSLGEYPFSVSKLNQAIAGAFVLLWGMLFTRSFFIYMDLVWKFKGIHWFVGMGDCLWPVFVFVYLAVFLYLLYFACETHDVADMTVRCVAGAESGSEYHIYLREPELADKNNQSS